MRPSRGLLAFVGIFLLVFTAECNRDEGPTAPARTPQAGPRRTVVTGSNHRRPAEDRFVQLANEIPGFAGYYVDGSHRLVAYIKDSTTFGSAAATLGQHIASDFTSLPQRVRPHGVTIKKADYDFQTLSNYRDIVTDSILGSVSGVLFDDLDEAINRVTVGVLTSQATSVQAAVTARLNQFGVPLAAVHFVNSAPIIPAAAPAVKRAAMLSASILETHADTLGAGIVTEGVPSTGVCTIGAIVDSGSTRMFVTASHCTEALWWLDRDTSFEDDRTPIGLERADPLPTRSCTFFPSKCWWHRGSDASLIDFSLLGLSHQRRGVIARPASRDSISPSQIGTGVSRDTSINSTKPWLFVTGSIDASQVPSGTEVDHVGMRSGWVYGTVTHTCVDWFQGSDTTEVYCGDEADGVYARQGDSGGPVFIWDGADGVILVGIADALYGTTASYNGPGNPPPLEGQGTYFSTWSNVQADLGTLNVTSGITVGAPSVSGSLSGNPSLTWSAVSTNGTNTTQYTIGRSVWDASTYTWISQGNVGTTTSTSYTDTSVPVSLTAYDGTSRPAGCTYTYVVYTVTAYNSGASAVSAAIYFQGAANGPDPGQINCGDT